MKCISQRFRDLDSSQQKALLQQMELARISYNKMVDYINDSYIIGNPIPTRDELKEVVGPNIINNELIYEIYKQMESQIRLAVLHKSHASSMPNTSFVEADRKILKHKSPHDPLKLELKRFYISGDYWRVSRLPRRSTTQLDFSCKRFPLPEKAKMIKINKIILTKSRYGSDFRIQFVCKEEYRQSFRARSRKKIGLGIDLGLVNLMSCVTSTGSILLISGDKIRDSINKYTHIIDHLHRDQIRCRQFSTASKQQRVAHKKFSNRMNYYLYKAVRLVEIFCFKEDVSVVILGYNRDFTKNINLNARLNRQATYFPYRRLIKLLQRSCKKNGIKFILQDESFTSKASFFDHDGIPTYQKEQTPDYAFSGKRVTRNLYVTSDGTRVHADINAALNILRKSKAVPLKVLGTGDLSSPTRISL